MFFNPGGPAGLHPVFMRGGRSVIFPGFDPHRFLTAIPEYRVTNTILVPTMIGMVVAQPDCERYDLSSMRGIITGGAPFRAELLARAREVFGDVFYPIYGMAETYSNGLVLRRENQFTSGTDEQVRRLGSVGKPNVLMQVRVVDDEGKDVPRDGTSHGEIWMQGDTVSPGYFRMPEETRASRAGEWFMSGDVAVMDAEGFITIVDRKKDMIITGGINVFSVEVENALLEHPDVVGAAVIGLPHETWGEAIHAVLVRREGSEAGVEEVLDFAAGRLASYKKPRSGEFVDALPMSATGKLLKKELRAERAAQAPGA
jgi:acyl-CoA synthetase (AMP-forming)/AMP-acid ligase II